MRQLVKQCHKKRVKAENKMIKVLMTISLFSLLLNADIISYYKNVQKTLAYDKTYSLYKKANNISKESINYTRYANFAFDANYASTKAKTLSSPFSTTDMVFNDTLDLFGKRSYKVKELSLDLKEKKSLLNLEKEQLFTTLVYMLSQYHKVNEQLLLHKILLTQQESIYIKLQKLQNSGVITSIDLLRFKNTLTALKTKVISEEFEQSKMKKQLKLYAPHEDIPSLKQMKLLYVKEDFLSYNPALKINELNAKRLNIQARSSQNNYLPDVIAGVAYQQLGDPTGYGDNYSFKIGLHMLLNGGDFKQAEALRLQALMQQSKTFQYKINRKNRYTKLYEDYLNAQKQLAVLQEALDDYDKSEKTIKIAFLKQYVDFNTYIQVLTQTLNIKEQIIAMKYQKSSCATILNMISSGKIYE